MLAGVFGTTGKERVISAIRRILEVAGRLARYWIFSRIFLD
jgi:hypothetical protein